MIYNVLAGLLASIYISQGQDSIQKKSSCYTLHAQETTVSQFRPKFSAAYTGAHSQVPIDEWGTTVTSTIFAGVKLWRNAQAFINPEIAGGHGLSSAFGIAAFTNGEAFRVGNPDPTIYLARAFIRQVLPLSEERVWQDDGDNKIAQYVPTKFIALTVGKVSVADYFDDNTFSHNPRTQFLNWGLMSNGAWDYPANTRGYTPSVIIECVSPVWEIRYGISMMPVTSNGNTMDNNVGKANANSFEIKYKYKVNGRTGKISGLAFYNTAFMGSYSAPNLISTRDSANPALIHTDYTIVASRQYGRSKYGFGINFEQSLANDIGIFTRASYNDGKNETWCFTEIDQAFSAGIVIGGSQWRRKKDGLGFAYCLSGLSSEHKAYLENGGLGFILGDGKLNYANEHLFETYYSATLNDHINFSFFYQFVLNPAYNRDRGPINIYSIRVHLTI